MRKNFGNIMKETRGLIDEWSAPRCNSEQSAGITFLLAVSGGVDSMCMAELFAGLEDPVDFAIAHCNFNLRGTESDGDEALVRAWAEEHGVTFHVRSFDTEEYARKNGISIEMAARDLRYTWFERLCAENGYGAVAVAHNANDNAETLMLNILRGCGPRGLSGMEAVSSLPCASSAVPLVRPLLTFTRKQIEGYMFACKAMYREDSTNSLSDYKRNRIRNEAFPIFEKLNPSFVRTMNREMGYFSEASDIVEDYCRSRVGNVLSDVKAGKTLVSVSIPKLMEEKHWRYLLYHILEPFGFNHAVLASIEDLLVSDRTMSGKRFLSQSHILLVERENMTIVPACGPESVPQMVEVTSPGVWEFNGRTFHVEMLPWDQGMPLRQPEGTLMMDAGKLSFPFVLRSWNSGDWMIPLGMRGKKKISDLFTDLKYDNERKKSAVIVSSDADDMRRVAAVACVRVDNAYKITEKTEHIIRIIEKNHE